MNGRRGGDELARLIERSAELKRDLVDFACSPRMQRSLAAAMRQAGLEEFKEADAIGIIDRFALQYRMRDGRTVVDRFVASRPDLDAADREESHGGRRRRYYRLTRDGRRALAAEAELRSATARVVRARLGLAGGEAAG